MLFYYPDWGSIHFAVFFDVIEVVKMLFNNGADLNKRTRKIDLCYSCGHHCILLWT